MNTYEHQARCIHVLAVIMLCAHRERMTCDAVAMMYCEQYAELYRSLVSY